jgi:hypothetical protein
MKPFDLERAKAGDPIVTRDGRKAKFIAHIPEADKQQRIIVLVGKDVYGVRESGKFKVFESDNVDLFMASKKRTVWVNLYPDHWHASSDHWHASFDTEEEADADQWDNPKRIGDKAYPIEIEE